MSQREHFEGLAEHCLDECANHLLGRREVFLWNARRVVEAMLLARVGADVGKGKEPPGLESLIARAKSHGHLRDAAVASATAVQQMGNLGAHPQALERVPTEAELDAARANLVIFVRTLWPQPWSPTIEDAIAVLERKRERPSPSRRSKELRDALEVERDTLRAEGDALRSERDSVRAERDAMRTERDALHIERDDLKRGKAESALQPSGKRYWYLAAGLGGGALLGAAFLVRREAPASSNEAAVPAIAPEPLGLSAPPTNSAAGPANAAAVDGGPARSAAAPAPPASTPVLSASIGGSGACSAGRILVDEQRFSLGQPHPRPGWPPAAAGAVQARVEAFCVDVRPVSANEFLSCVSKGRCPEMASTVASCNSKGDVPMNCVSSAAAEAYCAFAEGRLPSLVEWEAEIRARGTSIAEGNDSEWTLDPFPAPILRRGTPSECSGLPCERMLRGQLLEPIDNPRFSWNRTRADQPGVDIVFRCASAPGAAR